jgi:hypothetical protein
VEIIGNIVCSPQMRPFESCRERIERAKAHRDALADDWNNFIKEDSYSVRVHVQTNGTGRIYVTPKFSALPPRFSLEFGEMVYQLRAALDGCVYEAAVLHSKQNPPPDEDHLEFPICKSEGGFKNSARSIKPLPQECRDFIELVQPYKVSKTVEPKIMVMRFNRSLGILHDWARKDRHRKLHLLGAWATKASPMVRVPSGVTVTAIEVAGFGFLREESEIAKFRIDGFRPGMKVRANPNLAIDIAVDEEPLPCAPSDVLGNRLFNIFLFVDSAVSAFEAFFVPEG